MTKPKKMFKAIQGITSALIKSGLSEDQRFPCLKNDGISIILEHEGFEDISKALKNIDYKDIFHHLEKHRQYNIKFLDGGLLQLLYKFDIDNTLIKHRLSYFPSPSFEAFQNEPEIYLDDSNFYAEVIQKSILPVPIRFDFDPLNEQELKHPASHLTIGQYKNCRIPVVSPLCPSTFVNFILFSFYNTAAFEINHNFKTDKFTPTIKCLEKASLHLSIE